jgi:hypothetical protein
MVLGSAAHAGGGERRYSLRNEGRNASKLRDTTTVSGFNNMKVSVPDGHEVLRRHLKARGLSGAYDSLVFHDWRGGITIETAKVQNFWHADGKWHYRTTVRGDWMAEKITVNTVEGQKITVRPNTDFEPTRVQLQTKR